MGQGRAFLNDPEPDVATVKEKWYIVGTTYGYALLCPDCYKAIRSVYKENPCSPDISGNFGGKCSDCDKSR